MNNLSQLLALVVSFLAGLRLLVEELTRAELIRDGGTAAGWIETLVRMVLTPLPVSNFLVLAFSLSVLVILYSLGRTTRRSSKQRPLPPIPQQESVRQAQPPVSLPPALDSQVITKDHVDAEWNDLEEADKETIRELIVQGGLWESDIIALLQVRGLLSQHARYDSLADRVSFVECDYAGYYSIQPEYQRLLEDILAQDYADYAL